tara:strand:+ start:807 stop:1205 length:399 start_codon:yes stop_codon:yes gene_type:complete
MKNSTFKMSGFPRHAGVSPMRDVKPGTTARAESTNRPNIDIADEDREYEIIDDQIVFTSPNVDRNTGEILTSKPPKDKNILSPKNKEKINIFAEGVGTDLAKAAAVTAVGKLFSEKKKKESTRIISKDWKIT